MSTQDYIDSKAYKEKVEKETSVVLKVAVVIGLAFVAAAVFSRIVSS